MHGGRGEGLMYGGHTDGVQRSSLRTGSHARRGTWGTGVGMGGRSGVQRSLSPPSPASPSAQEWTALIKKHTTKVSVAGL